VPPTFDLDKARFGQLSGMSYEQRLLSAFRWGLLPLKAGKARSSMCTHCAEAGHWASECPNFFN
jgi:hypothetical protein